MTVDDADRLRAVRASGLLDADADPAIDALTSLAAMLVGAPVGLISLVDEDRQVFFSRQGMGIRETPISHSFCRLVVNDGEPLVVADAREDERLADHPAIEDLGVVAYCGVPVTDDDGNVLGSFCAIDHAPHEWTQAEVNVLRILADALRSRLTIELRHRKLVGDLQQRLVPQTMPGTSRWDIDAAYRPAAGHNLGGDFFDVVGESEGDAPVTVVLGDVVGHGLDATVATAQVKAATRAMIDSELPIDAVVSTLDRTVRDFQGALYSACAIARFGPGPTMHHICCGFLPPVVVAADGSTTILETAQTPPLSIGIDRKTVTTDLSDARAVVFFTDGLVERRDEIIDRGLERAARVAAEIVDRPDPAVAMVEGMGDEFDDDLAVVVVRQRDHAQRGPGAN